MTCASAFTGTAGRRQAPGASRQRRQAGQTGPQAKSPLMRFRGLEALEPGKAVLAHHDRSPASCSGPAGCRDQMLWAGTVHSQPAGPRRQPDRGSWCRAFRLPFRKQSRPMTDPEAYGPLRLRQHCRPSTEVCPLHAVQEEVRGQADWPRADLLLQELQAGDVQAHPAIDAPKEPKPKRPRLPLSEQSALRVWQALIDAKIIPADTPMPPPREPEREQ